MVQYKEIIDIAKKQIKSVEANNELAHSYKWAYYFASSLIKPKSNIKSIKFGKASNPKGTPFKKNVPINFIMKWGKQMVAYVQKNKKMPSYAVWGKINIHPNVYCYLFAKVLLYYTINGKLPESIPINTSIFKTKKKYGRSTEYGCDNRGQNNGHNCGPHMLQEIFRNLTGVVVPQSQIAGWAGTTTDGTDHYGLNTAIAMFNKKYGYNLTVEWKNFSDVGWNGIKKIIESKNQDCGLHELYRNTWGHYTNFDKIYDDTIDVHNSLGDSCNYGCYCGYTENRNKSEAKQYLSGISQKSVLIVTNK